MENHWIWTEHEIIEVTIIESDSTAFSNLFGSKIKIPGKEKPGGIEIYFTALKTDVLGCAI